MERFTYTHLLLFGFILTGCSGPSSPSSEESDTSKTVDKQLLKEASAGDPEAQYQISRQYYDTGKAEDYRKSIEFLTKSAEQGHAQAQYRLAQMYLMGHGGSINYAEAGKWLGKAAEQGLPEAQYDLGMYYICGRAFPPEDLIGMFQFIQKFLGKESPLNKNDVELGSSWLRKAKDQGSTEAAELLERLSILRFYDFTTGRFDAQAFQKAMLSETLGEYHIEALLKERLDEESD